MSTDHAPPQGKQPLTIAEIADLTTRLYALTTTGRAPDPAERAAFLTDKAALLARIPHDTDQEAAHG